MIHRDILNQSTYIREASFSTVKYTNMARFQILRSSTKHGDCTEAMQILKQKRYQKSTTG